jgi:hypothetical protein
MPKLFGNSLLSLILATIVFYMLGFLWYGFLFADSWMHLTGITEADAKIMQDKLGAMMFVWGILISLMQVLGIAAVLNLAGASRLVTCVKITSMLAIMIVLPVISYGALYEGVSIHLIGIDFLHLLLGYILIGATLSFFRDSDGQ